MVRKFILLVSFFILTACFNDMPPRCDSTEVKETLSKLITPLLRAEGMTNIKFSGHEEIDRFENAREYRCEARANYREGKNISSEVIDYSVFWESDKQDYFIIQINEEEEWPWDSFNW